MRPWRSAEERESVEERGLEALACEVLPAQE